MPDNMKVICPKEEKKWKGRFIIAQRHFYLVERKKAKFQSFICFFSLLLLSSTNDSRLYFSWGLTSLR